MTKYYAGGKHGNGKQMFSWIHINDLCSIFDFVIHNDNINDVVNCAAPNPITNKVFMSKLRKKLRVNFGIPSPKWLLQLGAFFLGTETELLLKSRWVVSKKLKELNYKFEFETIDEALENLIK